MTEDSKILSLVKCMHDKALEFIPQSNMSCIINDK